jgi:16S rRNA (cytidine1402-2'-O)-methyltransferase
MIQGTLYVVSTPVGHLDDLTLRAVTLLREAAVVAAEDPQQARILFERHAIEASITSYHNDNKETKTEILLTYLKDGKNVALVVDAGTPVVADPGRYLIEQAIAAGIPVSPVPGHSAVLAALAVSGLSGDSFLFAGMLPRGPRAMERLLARLKTEPRTIVLLAEPPSRLRVILGSISKVLGNRRVVLAKDLTTASEECVRGEVDGLLATMDARESTNALTIVVAGRPETRRKPGRRRVRRRDASG